MTTSVVYRVEALSLSSGRSRTMFVLAPDEHKAILIAGRRLHEHYGWPLGEKVSTVAIRDLTVEVDAAQVVEEALLRAAYDSRPKKAP